MGTEDGGRGGKDHLIGGALVSMGSAGRLTSSQILWYQGYELQGAVGEMLCVSTERQCLG